MAKKISSILSKQTAKIQPEEFYRSDAWRRLRYRVLLKYGSRCQCCGASPPFVDIHVDHIKPASKYPELMLDFDNLQVLCLDCNFGKSNVYETDHRQKSRKCGDGDKYKLLLEKKEFEELDQEEKNFIRRHLHQQERRK